ncbi:uncharacterized protein LOC111861692 isoform X2 [Cryptotermes secundus]|uniref:uncharacterized protein LOC111861692 isoform X2 n=1 Tax=Cryptotermes secundus TaxID=105785 RepID=UPI000CD7CE3A|nr:uncharacterized protein LOC111861692 isoform X2 [Cryptotermes secundus]
MPRIVLQRAEETFPAVTERMNCTNSEKVLVGPYGETYPARHDANQAMNIKAEEVSDSQEEVDPVQVTVQEVKAETEVSRLQRILHSPATKVARIVLQRAEEKFPAMREGMNCRNSENAVVGPYGETYPTPRDANQAMNVKAEAVSDAEEEEDPVLITFPKIKAEPEVAIFSHLWAECSCYFDT